MKLLSVKLDGTYKCLKDQTFDFSSSDGTMLAFVGLNGSGKSQLLELIAESFAYLERYLRGDFLTRKRLPFSITLTYALSDDRPIKVVIDHRDGISINDHLVYNHSSMVRDILPRFIIGYSSGLNENLQRSFLKNALQFHDIMRIRSNRLKRLSEEKERESKERIHQFYAQRYARIFHNKELYSPDRGDYTEADTSPSNMVYLDYDTTGLLLTALSILEEDELSELLSEVRYHKPTKIVLHYDLTKHAIAADTLLDIRMLIEIAGRHNVKGLSPKTTDDLYDLYELDYLEGEVTLDLTSRIVLEQFRDRNSNSPFDLFNRLHKIQLLGLDKIHIKDRRCLLRDDFFGNVKKPLKLSLPLNVKSLELANDKGEVVNFDDLSDGETQLIQVLASTRIFGEDETLFIFDEPETHLNPSWRTYFHEYIERALPNDPAGCQFLISTHSPFLVSALKKESVYLCKRDEEGSIEVTQSPKETYGASFDVLIKQLFPLKTLISQSVVKEINEWLEEEKDPEKRQIIFERVNAKLGDSLEKIYLLKRLNPDAS